MTSKSKDSTDMEVDIMFQRKEEEDEEMVKKDSSKTSDSLFFMEPDHKEFRAKEDQEAQEYWEAGITKKCLNALRTGGVDHLQKQCYHCSRKGHIKTNCPKSRKLGGQPWKKKVGRGKMFGKDNSSGREAKGKKTMKRNLSPSKKQEVKPLKKPNRWARIFNRGRHEQNQGDNVGPNT